MRAAFIFCLLGLAALVHAAAAPLCANSAGTSVEWRSRDAAFVIQTGTGVQRHALTLTADGGASVAAAATWNAAALLTGDPLAMPPLPPTPAPERRNIYTSAPATLAFDWPALPPQLRVLLDADGQGEARTAYLRGDRRLEIGQPGGIFRKRVSVLGDIDHGMPLIVGAPPASGVGQGYAAFREQAKSRALAVYVGANDGMLHAFAAGDGTELFAYVPRTLIASLAELSDPAAPARPYVDASAGQGDALVGARWRTVLASGMGMGARGVFALDITDPAAFSGGLGALWEFTERDDPAIGNVQTAPQIARLNTGARGAVPAYRDVAVVPSTAPNGDGTLFLLALDKPTAQQWRAGLNYYRISTGDGALSAPALVVSADGSATLAYAGDLQGRLWRFDLGAKTAQRIFTARDDAGRAQPIAYAPKVVFAPGGGYLVLFGAGKTSEPADLLASSFTPQTMYAILDRLEVPADPVRSRSQLAKRTLSGTDGYTVTGAPIDYFAPGAKRGWYADFLNTAVDGERVAGSPVTSGGSVIFDTVLPGSSPCDAATSRLYVLDAVSGLVAGTDRMALTGEPAPAPGLLRPLLLEGLTSVGPQDGTGAATASRSFALIRPVPGQQAGKAQQVVLRFPAKRLGWREVSNWQELHDAAKKQSDK